MASCNVTNDGIGVVFDRLDASNSTVFYQCLRGYYLLSGNLTRTCLDDGSLSGSAPICISDNSTTGTTIGYVVTSDVTQSIADVTEDSTTIYETTTTTVTWVTKIADNLPKYLSSGILLCVFVLCVVLVIDFARHIHRKKRALRRSQRKIKQGVNRPTAFLHPDKIKQLNEPATGSNPIKPGKKRKKKSKTKNADLPSGDTYTLQKDSCIRQWQGVYYSENTGTMTTMSDYHPLPRDLPPLRGLGLDHVINDERMAGGGHVTIVNEGQLKKKKRKKSRGKIQQGDNTGHGNRDKF